LPIPLCNECGEPLNARGRCVKCDGGPTRVPAKSAKRPASDELLNLDEPPRKRPATPAAVTKPPPLPAKPTASKASPRPVTRKDSGEDDFFRLSE